MEDVPLGSDEDETRKERENSPTEGNSLGLCFRKKLARSFNNH